jgi:hypothetical protein
LSNIFNKAVTSLEDEEREKEDLSRTTIEKAEDLAKKQQKDRLDQIEKDEIAKRNAGKKGGIIDQINSSGV